MPQIDDFINYKRDNKQFYLNTGLSNPPKIEKTDNNTANNSSVITAPEPKQTEKVISTKNSSERDEFVKIKQSNGVIRKFYNYLKDVTGIGFGSKALEKEIGKFEKGEITKEQLDDKFSKYKISQENSIQTVSDVAAGVASISLYKFAYKHLRNIGANLQLNLKFKKELSKKNRLIAILYKYDLDKLLRSKIGTTLLIMPFLALLGGITKKIITDIDTIGSKEYRINKKDFKDKKEYKAARKAMRKARRKHRFSNFFTGAADGILAPLTVFGGGIVGVPAYLASTLLIRYSTNKNNEDDKSISNFAQEFKDNVIVNSLGALLVAIPAYKKGQFIHTYNKNLKEVVGKLRNKSLKEPDLPSSKSAYQILEDKMLESDEIQSILESNDKMNDKITALINENIFAAKFLQIERGGRYNDLSNALREECPPSRTIEQAQELINKALGSDNYEVSKLVGVGTVAESYIAKNKSGEEVCIKVLKDGISADKIKNDKEKFIKMVTGNVSQENWTKEQKYLVKNIDNLADGIAKEVDFNNEMEAAIQLSKYTKIADVVKPIEVKNGVYVMEKAPGISVKTFADYYSEKSKLIQNQYNLEKTGNEGYKEIIKQEIKSIEDKIEKIKSKSPDFQDFDFDTAKVKKVLNTYINLKAEQFSKIYKDGKVIHGDIHPGNIFINLANLESGEGKLFTLIDTGNTINMTKEQSKTSLKIIANLENGNIKDLTDAVLDDAILPAGMTREQAVQNLSTDLKKYFFDYDTKIGKMSIDNFYVLTDNILQKYNIIPNNTQLNLNKAKKSAENSFKDLFYALLNEKYGDKDIDNMSKVEKGKTIVQVFTNYSLISFRDQLAMKLQETKSLFQISFKEAIQFLKNPNKLKTNSKEHLTYVLKQNIFAPDNIKNKFSE